MMKPRDVATGPPHPKRRLPSAVQKNWYCLQAHASVMLDSRLMMTPSEPVSFSYPMRKITVRPKTGSSIVGAATKKRPAAKVSFIQIFSLLVDAVHLRVNHPFVNRFRQKRRTSFLGKSGVFWGKAQRRPSRCCNTFTASSCWQRKFIRSVFRLIVLTSG